MTQVQITAADVTDADLALFSDMYKECYNVRPRFTPTKQDYADLANRYDEIQKQNDAEERAWLDYEETQAGRTFANVMEYYNWYEVQQELKHQEKLAAKAEAAELAKPGIKNLIDRWDHGEI